MAAETGDAEAVAGFLSAGADVNWQNEHGETALIYSAWGGHEAAVATLLHHPATHVNLQVRKHFGVYLVGENVVSPKRIQY